MDVVADNISKLKELFPEILAENKIDFKALQALLGEDIEVEDERYSFNWHGKAQARRLAQSPSTGTLRPCKEESVDWGATQNLFIEGDNLEVLKLLQKSYHKQVKMIYIDPPYNTGSDFVYPDDFKDSINNYLELTGQAESGRKKGTNAESSGRYHTDWLNMLYPRLKLARNLLRDDGAIFISIDDTEHSNLKKICDEIYGEDNFIANIIWEKKFAPQNDAKWLSDNHDHILCYAKNSAQFKVHLLARTEEANNRYRNVDNDPRGNWASDNLLRKDVQQSGLYTITTPSGKKYDPPSGRSWRVPESKLFEMVKDNRIWFGADGSNVPRIKRFLTEVQDGMRPMTIWKYTEVGHNQEASQELRKLFNGESYFDTPKPVKLIKRICEIATSDNDLILDFFSGSSTTAHAVLEINNVDEANRKFIMIQLPEPFDEGSDAFKAGYKTIADIGKDRVRLAGEKIKEETADYQGDLGFKVFKLDSSNLKPWDADFNSLAQDLAEATEVVKADRKPEDVLFEILLKYGLDLTLPIDTHTISGKTVYEVGAGALIVCLDDGVTEAVAEGIGKLKEELEPEVMRVVFKDSSFASDAAKVNAVQVLKQYGIDDVKSI